MIFIKSSIHMPHYYKNTEQNIIPIYHVIVICIIRNIFSCNNYYYNNMKQICFYWRMTGLIWFLNFLFLLRCSQNINYINMVPKYILFTSQYFYNVCIENINKYSRYLLTLYFLVNAIFNLVLNIHHRITQLLLFLTYCFDSLFFSLFINL